MSLDDFNTIQSSSLALPDQPGVYFFIGPEPKKEILYIGRATSLKDRVRSYFSDDLIHTRGALIVDMVFRAATVDFVATDSVLEAIILEANLIKKHQPYCNTKEKDDKSFNYVIITREKFPQVFTMRGKDFESHKALGKKAPFEIAASFGPYLNGSVLREGLALIRKMFPFRDAKCTPGQGKPCFYRQIGLCPGVCTGEISAKDYARQIRNISYFFEGKKTKLIADLTREMNAFAKKEEFEKANEVKKTIFSLEHIRDVHLIKEEQDMPVGLDDVKHQSGVSQKQTFEQFRMEAYDIAHLSGKNMVGVMTVLEGRELKKADYRMFKIKTLKGADDTAALREVLERRLNHSEWPYPHLIIVDGSIAQRRTATDLLAEKGFDISVVAVVKNDKHRPDRILGDRELTKKYSKEILLLNSEAHRFAIKYHRKIRGALL